MLQAGGAITSVLVNPWLDNVLTGGTPSVVAPLVIALPGTPVPFQNKVTPLKIPIMLTPAGQPVFPPGQPTDKVAPQYRI